MGGGGGRKNAVYESVDGRLKRRKKMYGFRIIQMRVEGALIVVLFLTSPFPLPSSIRRD